MAGIAGIARDNAQGEVSQMLDHMPHRGRAGREIRCVDGVTLGACWPEKQAFDCVFPLAVVDRFGTARVAEARVRNGVLLLKRDAVGAAPLYYGHNDDGSVMFASEIKALCPYVRDLHELPPGALLEGKKLILDNVGWRRCCVADPIQDMVLSLRNKLDEAIWRCVSCREEAGVWLSGGLDSSMLAALARPYVSKLHTFTIGMPNAPDLACAREVAAFLQCDHHEIVVTSKQMRQILWDVIYHLESFDALLVRSSVMNFLLAKNTSLHVPIVFSGEGGDELFAGYEHMKTLDHDALSDELVAITGRLHNTTLQRVDRCAAAHGLLVHLGFLDPDVVDYALRIPATHKIVKGVEKWILREAAKGLLPESVRLRPKAKFWDGAGLRNTLFDLAAERISDTAFAKERNIGTAEPLQSKEELMYYRHFRECFGQTIDPRLVGRTKTTIEARGSSAH